jgi:uncharacterized protein YndB with AHSA1/START domain
LIELTDKASLAAMPDVATSIFIAAKPNRVWKHVSAFARYEEWNPFIVSVEGQRAVGEKIAMTFRLAAADGRGADHSVAARIIKVEDDEAKARREATSANDNRRDLPPAPDRRRNAS